MVLANAVYFKGSWKHAFRASATKVKPFYSTEEVQKVEMMHQRQFFRVAHLEGTDARAIELPYIVNIHWSLPYRTPNGRTNVISVAPEQATIDRFLNQPSTRHTLLTCPGCAMKQRSHCTWKLLA